jgi:hypothetical protein
MQPRRQPKKRRSHRGLIAVILVIGALAFGWVHIVHGSSTAAPKYRTVASCRRALHHRGKHACVTQRRAAVRYSPLHAYAVGLRAVLLQARRAFDQASAAVQTTDLATLSTVCGTYGDQITIVEAQVDGVPHPGPWYQPVSRLHFTLMGEFHDMLGALQVCQTASGNDDAGTVAVAQSDVAVADERIRATDDYAVSLSRR